MVSTFSSSSSPSSYPSTSSSSSVNHLLQSPIFYSFSSRNSDTPSLYSSDSDVDQVFLSKAEDWIQRIIQSEKSNYNNMCDKKGSDEEDAAVDQADFKSQSSAAAVAELLKSGGPLRSTDYTGGTWKNDDVFKSSDLSGVFKSQDSFFNKLLKGNADATSAATATTAAAESTSSPPQHAQPPPPPIPAQIFEGSSFRPSTSIPHPSTFASRDWMSQFESSHVDVDPEEVFQSSDSTKKPPPTADLSALFPTSLQMQQALQIQSSLSSSTRKKRGATDWDAMYEQSLPSAAAAIVPSVPATTQIPAPVAELACCKCCQEPCHCLSFPDVPDVKPSVENQQQQQPQQPDAFAETIKLTEKLAAKARSQSPEPPKRILRSTSSNVKKPEQYVSAAPEPLYHHVDSLRTASESESETMSSSKGSKTKVINNGPPSSNRSKTSRAKKYKDPEVKVYHEPKDEDVLLGRGGRTNHHPGNKRYLEAKELIQDRYIQASKNEKTDISQELVDIVHEWNGRFLQLDEAENKWFEVTNIKARKKASQSLREVNTPEQRAAKRAKYGK